MALESGRTAPYFSMVAAGSGRRVSLRSCAGRPLVLIFHGRGDEDAVREINREVRSRFPDPDGLTIASVIDLSFVPPIYWAAANIELDRAYREAARELPGDVDPRDYIYILPDWAGSTARKYRAKGTSGVVAVVVDANSGVLLHHSGHDASGRVLEALGEG